MSKPIYGNIKNLPANLLAFLLVVITPKIFTNYNIFQSVLLKDEKILWAGQPETKFMLKEGDIGLSLFGLAWTGFMSLFFFE